MLGYIIPTSRPIRATILATPHGPLPYLAEWKTAVPLEINQNGANYLSTSGIDLFRHEGHIVKQGFIFTGNQQHTTTTGCNGQGIGCGSETSRIVDHDIVRCFELRVNTSETAAAEQLLRIRRQRAC